MEKPEACSSRVAGWMEMDANGRVAALDCETWDERKVGAPQPRVSKTVTTATVILLSRVRDLRCSIRITLIVSLVKILVFRGAFGVLRQGVSSESLPGANCPRAFRCGR